MPIAVYLAGKIRKNGWRNIVAPDIRAAALSADEVYENTFTVTKIPSLITSGPYFICCDHGCYHGDGTHGVGSNDQDGCSGKGIPAGIVPTICQLQIRRSNFVFAYIDDSSCYGTLCEIGYAIGIGRPVAVMFSRKDLSEDMWFITESADMVFNKFGGLMKSGIKDTEVFNAATKIAELIAGGDT